MAKDSKDEGEGSNNNRLPCAACRHQRRKCKEDCFLAPYFPIEKTQQYLAVHRVFGFSNMTKILSNLNEQQRLEAVMSFEWEALMWQQDPVFGPLGAYKRACNMIRTLLLTQQTLPSSEPKLMMGLTHDLSLFNNGGNNEALAVALSNNGVPPLTNNNSFGDIFGNEVEDSKALIAPNALYHGQPLLLRSSSILQPNYMPSLTSIDVPDVDQPNQMRGFEYYNANRVENIYFDGYGQRRGISQRGRTEEAQEDTGVGIPP